MLGVITYCVCYIIVSIIMMAIVIKEDRNAKNKNFDLEGFLVLLVLNIPLSLILFGILAGIYFFGWYVGVPLLTLLSVVATSYSAYEYFVNNKNVFKPAANFFKRLMQ